MTNAGPIFSRGCRERLLNRRGTPREELRDGGCMALEGLIAEPPVHLVPVHEGLDLVLGMGLEEPPGQKRCSRSRPCAPLSPSPPVRGRPRSRRSSGEGCPGTAASKPSSEPRDLRTSSGLCQKECRKIPLGSGRMPKAVDLRKRIEYEGPFSGCGCSWTVEEAHRFKCVRSGPGPLRDPSSRVGRGRRR